MHVFISEKRWQNKKKLNCDRHNKCEDKFFLHLCHFFTTLLDIKYVGCSFIVFFELNISYCSRLSAIGMQITCEFGCTLADFKFACGVCSREHFSVIF